MLMTPKIHFEEDINRARDLCTHAQALSNSRLRDDVLRATWMMAVGACDAYFSDAYADLISRTLRAKALEPNVAIPDRLNNLRIPVVAVLREANCGWRWRMAARELIEEENVLSLDKIRKLFNQFFPEKGKLLNQNTIEKLILHRQAKSRVFGITKTRYRAKSGVAKSEAKKAAMEHFNDHYELLFQRRHDCIHNCDRPKMTLQAINHTIVLKRVEDIEFLVSCCHDDFLARFPDYLATLEFNAVTRNQVCA